MTMFRFTIRDVLWLTVVVAMGLGWMLNASSTSSFSELENECHKRLVTAALEWAKEKGEPAYVDAGGHTIEAKPDGTVRLLSHVDPKPPK